MPKAPPRSAAKRPSPKGRATKSAPGARGHRSNPPRRFRSGRIVRAGLIAVTIAAGAGLAAIPVGDWFEQQSELDDARSRKADLQSDIDGIRDEIESITGESGIEARSLCYGPYVAPGVETYSIPGVRGCLGQP